jgi:hypothetical protein
MKHIKKWSIFEGFNTDDYYQEIDYEEWFIYKTIQFKLFNI